MVRTECKADREFQSEPDNTCRFKHEERFAERRSVVDLEATESRHLDGRGTGRSKRRCGGRSLVVRGIHHHIINVERVVHDADSSELRQSLDAENNNRQQNDYNGSDRNHARRNRTLRVFHEQPDSLLELVSRHPRRRRLPARVPVALQPAEALDHLLVELIELQLLDEDVWMHGERSAQTPAALVVVENGVEARSVSVEEKFAPLRVVVTATFAPVSEQSLRIAFERRAAGVETHPTDVDHDSIIVLSITSTNISSSSNIVVNTSYQRRPIQVVAAAVLVGDVIDSDADVIGRCDVAGRWLVDEMLRLENDWLSETNRSKTHFNYWSNNVTSVLIVRSE